MKYKIRYRTYDERDLIEGVSVIEAEGFIFKNNFVSIWTECSGTQAPDLYINANDVLTIKRID